jgi:hypothetical protein
MFTTKSFASDIVVALLGFTASATYLLAAAAPFAHLAA